MSTIGPKPSSEDFDPLALANMSVVRGFDGEFDQNVFIKTFQPSTQTHEDLVGAPADHFTESANLQQQLTAAGARHWAPIQAVGVGPNGPYYVSRLFPTSAAQILASDVRLGAAAIHRIIEGALEGLRELKEFAHRPHGNLKPTNILISNAEDIAEAQVVLSDPASSERIAVDGSEIADLFAVGSLLHQLVFQRPFASNDRWPIPDSREWSRFGRESRTWRNLCSRLLNPNAQEGPLDLERALSFIRHLEPAKPRTWGRWMWSVAAVILVAGGAYLTLRVLPDLQGPKAPIGIPIPALDDFDKFRQMYAARKWDVQLKYLDELRSRVTIPTTDEDPPAFKELRDTQKLLKQIEAQWALVESNQQLFAQTGDPVLLSYGTFINGILQSSNQIGGQASLGFLEERVKFVLANKDWNTVAAFLRTPASNQIDRGYFISDSPVHKNWTENAIASDAVLNQWLTEAKSDPYKKLTAGDDPRTHWGASKTVEYLRDVDLQQFRALRPSQPDAASDKFLATAAQIDGKIGQLQSAGLEWSHKNEKQIREGIAQVDQMVSDLQKQVQEAIRVRGDEVGAEQAKLAMVKRHEKEIESFVSECLNSTLRATPDVEQEWQARNKQWAADIKADPTKFSEDLRNARERNRQALLAMDLCLRGMPAKLDLQAGAASWSAPLIETIQHLADDQRKQMSSESLSYFRANANHETIVDEVKSHCRDMDKKFGEWVASASALVAAFNEIDTVLGDGYTLGETSFDHAKSVRDLRAQWADKDLFRNESVQKILQPFSRQIDEVEGNDLAKLSRVANDESSRLGLRISAWQKLSAPESSWPATADDLKQNETTADALIRALDGIKEENRKAARKSELELAARGNWQRFLERVTRAEDVKFAIGLSKYGPTEKFALSGGATFNLTLYGMKTLLNGQASEQELDQQIAKLAQAAQQLPESVRSKPETIQLANALNMWKDSAAKLDLAKLGPMSARARAGNPLNWRVRGDDRTGTVTYSVTFGSEIPVDLVFRRVEIDPALPISYLCTCEMSVGFFSDVVAGSGKWPEMGKLLWNYEPRTGDPRLGPRIWEWRRDNKGVLGFWRTLVWLGGNYDHYPIELGTADNRSVLRDSSGLPSKDLNPTRKQPMQQISFEAARYFADLVGCRLQSPAEWKAALKQANRDERLNLRDHTWRLQRDWLTTLHLGDRDAPDAGMFVPANEPVNNQVWKDSQFFPTTRPVKPTEDREYDDGVLWFRDVAQSGTQLFSNLLGNVGEFAVGDGGKVYVIGGSALSPPMRPLDKELEVPDHAPRGYSDVGFRLAFSAPVRSIEQLRAAVERQTFLAASNAATTRPAQ